jgi:predicted DNA-binding protein YlxM (UPF0122 family)
MAIDRIWRAECLEDYVRDRMTAGEFAEHVGCSRDAAYGILSGKNWKTIPRPDGFMYPWPEHEERSSKRISKSRKALYAEGMRLYRENAWSRQELAEHLGVAMTTVRDLLKREGEL